MRVLRIFFIAALSVRALTGGTAPAFGADDKPVVDPTGPFFRQHCQGCHSGSKPKGKFLLESLSHDFANEANHKQWLTVLDQVKEGMMPPAEKPRPSAKEIQALVGWISQRTAAAE